MKETEMPKTTATAPTAAQLDACATRDAARALLPLALTRVQLNALAAELDMGSTGRDNKAALIERIVHRTVGYRVNSEAIRNSVAELPPRPTRADRVEALSDTDQALLATCVTSNHARLAATIRSATAAILQGQTGDPAALADLAAAAQALADAARPAATPPADAADALHAIRDNRRGSGWSSIADVRDALSHLAHGEQDALMIGLLRTGRVDIIPSANLKALSGRERDAALLLGGQMTHAIRVR
jgi:transglutaminase-like putative cysteine protease